MKYVKLIEIFNQWYERTRDLFEAAQDKNKPEEYRAKALGLYIKMFNRIMNIRKAINDRETKFARDFPSGGTTSIFQKEQSTGSASDPSD